MEAKLAVKLFEQAGVEGVFKPRRIQGKSGSGVRVWCAASVLALVSTVAYADGSTDTASVAADGAPGGPASKPNNFVDRTYDDWGLNHTRTDNLHKFYVGVGDTNSLLHANVEMPTRFGHVYVNVGKFFAGGNGAAQIGFRMPYHYMNEKDNDGFYLGAYAGDVVNSGIDGKQVNRLGGALELSYLLMDRTSLTSFSVAIGAAQRNSGGNPDEQKVTPMLMFGASWGFGIF